MREILLYFRRHRWQQLTLTLSFTAMLAAGLTILFRQPLGDFILIHRLTSSKPLLRQESVTALANRALASPKTRARLEKCLASSNDEKFLGVASALNAAGLLKVPGRDTNVLDRWRAARMAAHAGSRARYLIAWEACALDRDNAHIRRIMTTAASDDDAATRSLAGVLAAKLGDDATLAALLDDESAEVRAFAAIDAGIAARRDLLERTAAHRNEPDPYAADCMTYALALVDSDLAVPAVCKNLRLVQADDQQAKLSLDRNLIIADMLDDDAVTEAVGDLIAAYSHAGRHPPALAILAAARRGMAADVAPHVRRILQAAGDRNARDQVTVGHLYAALAAAETLEIPLRKEVFAVVETLWGPANENTMVAAARVLGLQADLPQNGPDGPTRDRCISLLQGRATWALWQQLPDEPDVLHYTPVASAAAALALWRLDADDAESALHYAASSQYTLPGDYIAWHVSLQAPPAGMELGMAMLPALDAPHELRVYNDNVRSAGAMMLALSARTDEQRQAAADRIRSRLIGGEYGGEDVRQVRWSYMCALAITGDDTYRQELSALLSVTEFPRRRLLTGLLLAGDREAMDWLLWHPQLSDASVVALLLDRRVGELLDAVAPGLPRVDWAAPQQVRLWQARILRETYAIHRAEIAPGKLP